MIKNFRVRRETNRIYVLDVLSDTYGISADKYMPISDQLIIKYITEEKSKGKTVFFDTDKKGIYSEVTKYRNIPSTDVNRVRILKKARDRLDAISGEVELIDYIRYMDANNVLNAKGFFITDDNREIKFLEILELGDDALIDTLEDFLTLKDKLSIIKSAKSAYDEVYDKILSTSESDVEKLSKIEQSISE